MRILSFAYVLLLLLLSFFVVVSPTVILTQNVTNTVEDSITVFPGITIQITCMVINSTSLLWDSDDGGDNAAIGSFNHMTFVTDEVGDFTILLSSYNSSLITSTATAVSSSNTSLTCSDGILGSNISATINIYIKPVDPQIYLVQNITSDSSNITICPNDPITFSCRSTTGILVWALDNGQTTSLTSFEEMMTLGDFELVVTNVTILSLGIESTATINSPVASFTLSCHTNATNGLNRLSSAIEVTVRSPPVPVSSVNVSEVCYDSISFNWTDTINSLDTPQLDHYLVSVTAQNTQMDYIVNGLNTSLTGLTSNELYTVSVISVNCAGNSTPMTVQRTITRQKPSVPTLQLLSDRSNASIATISIKWEPGVMTDCLQSPVTSYTIIVSGVMRTVHTVNGSVTNTTLTVPSCGASAVTVSAVNDVDSSDKSEPKIFRGTPLTLIVSTTAVDGDSVTLSVTITECLRSSVDNVTVTYRNEPSFGYTRTVSYPNNSTSVSITLSDLISTTDYNATVVVYYRESERTSVLGPSFLMFSTTEDLFSLQEAVIIGLSVGFGVSLLIMALLIVLLFAFCYKLRDQYKYGITLRKKFKSLVLRQKEIEEELRELRERRKTIKSIHVPHEQRDVQMRGQGKETIAQTVEISEM